MKINKEQTIWTDQDELEVIKENIDMVNNSTNKALMLLNRIGLYKEQLPRIGIYINNKMMEVFKYYRSKNVEFAHSRVKNAVYEYLMRYMLDQAIDFISSFYDKSIYEDPNNDKYSNPASHEDIENYIAICEEVYSFNIEEDVERAIDFYIDRYVNPRWYTGGLNEEIDEINKELKELGINLFIEHREELQGSIGSDDDSILTNEEIEMLILLMESLNNERMSTLDDIVKLEESFQADKEKIKKK